MFITKSLFKEFTQSPKLAWFAVNAKPIHTQIQEATYGGMDWAAMGQAVEDMVKKLYAGKTIAEVNSKNIDYQDRHHSYHQLSSKLLEQTPDVLYQAWFSIDNLFVKTDFLVLNENKSYDLVEVKSKNAIRADNKDQTLIDELTTDVSFQRYVLTKTLGEKFSWNCFIIYLNKEFVKHGEIHPQEILLQEQVNNDLMTDDAIESIVKIMQSDLWLSEKDFNAKYPYDGGDYLSYFGKESPKESIWDITGIAKGKKKALYDAGKTMIKDISDEDILTILCNKDGGESKQSRYLDLRKQGEEVIDKQAIREIFDGLRFPLFFYDYETVASPIPMFDGTKPWQAAVVQYSLHTIESDGTTKHYESIIDLGAPEIKKVIDQFVADVGEPQGTFVAWNKWFECSRNSESAAIYPEHKEFFEKVNAQTFDLIDIFKNLQYFHRAFGGSASIKKVLPVLTQISYDDLEVGNGGEATKLLQEIVLGTIDPKIYPSTVKNLLTYCEQDTRAMVRIWQAVKGKIG